MINASLLGVGFSSFVWDVSQDSAAVTVNVGKVVSNESIFAKQPALTSLTISDSGFVSDEEVVEKALVTSSFTLKNSVAKEYTDNSNGVLNLKTVLQIGGEVQDLLKLITSVELSNGTDKLDVTSLSPSGRTLTNSWTIPSSWFDQATENTEIITSYTFTDDGTTISTAYSSGALTLGTMGFRVEVA